MAFNMMICVIKQEGSAGSLYQSQHPIELALNLWVLVDAEHPTEVSAKSLHCAGQAGLHRVPLRLALLPAAHLRQCHAPDVQCHGSEWHGAHR